MQSITSFVPAREDGLHRNRRERSFRRQLSLVDLDDGAEVACVRFYGSGSRSYCCAWIHYPGYHASGSAWCGGGGYHKDSAAMQEALSLAGIQFADNFAGVGENGETEALQALARWLDVPRYTIIKAHG